MSDTAAVTSRGQARRCGGWRFTALVLALAVGVAGCRSRDDDGPVAEARGTGTTTPLTTATTAPADPYAVPATIDAAYVQRVLDALDRIDAEVFAEALAARQVTALVTLRLRSMYNPEELDRQVHALQIQLGRDLSVFKNPPGMRRTVVKRVVTARPDCILVEVEFDNTNLLKNPRPSPPTYLGLEPTAASSDPSNLNPTPYSIFLETVDFEDPCAVS